MRNIFCFACVTVSVIIIAAVCLICSRESKAAADFVKGYGWEINPHPIESIEVILPQEFDEVYKCYNELQKRAGLDLSHYKGKRAVRYTFSVNNYPIQSSSPVRANVLVVRGVAIGGDISTTALDGFMHSLNEFSER